VLILVRHGESTANAAGLLLGRSDPPLTEHGVAQAAAIGRALGPVSRVVSSPLARARLTAAALAGGLPVEIDERWIEVDYGDYEGQPVSEVPAEVWRQWRVDPDFCPSGGETLGQVAVRVGAACAELFALDGTGARDPAGDVVVVSHVSPIKAAVAWALGAGVELTSHLQLGTGSLSTLGWGRWGPLLHSYNVECHPRQRR
jgi:broad specificity phosphatase PhoE